MNNSILKIFSQAKSQKRSKDYESDSDDEEFLPRKKFSREGSECIIIFKITLT